MFKIPEAYTSKTDCQWQLPISNQTGSPSNAQSKFKHVHKLSVTINSLFAPHIKFQCFLRLGVRVGSQQNVVHERGIPALGCKCQYIVNGTPNADIKCSAFAGTSSRAEHFSKVVHVLLYVWSGVICSPFK